MAAGRRRWLRACSRRQGMTHSKSTAAASAVDAEEDGLKLVHDASACHFRSDRSVDKAKLKLTTLLLPPVREPVDVDVALGFVVRGIIVIVGVTGCYCAPLFARWCHDKEENERAKIQIFPS